MIAFFRLLKNVKGIFRRNHLWHPVGCLTIVRQHPYEITFVCLSVRPLVCITSLSFLEMDNLFFSDIAHGSWPWYLVTDEARVLEKKIGSPGLGPTYLNQTQNEVFCHFIEFLSYFFLQIAYSDTLWQFLMYGNDKIHDIH